MIKVGGDGVENELIAGWEFTRKCQSCASDIECLNIELDIGLRNVG